VVFGENGRVSTYGTSDSTATWPTSLAVSPNGTYVAYRVAGGDLVVRLVATGETVAHMPIGSKDQVQAVSDDGRLVALVASDMRPGVLYSFPPPPETVAIANLVLHERGVPRSIERVLTDRPHGDESLGGLAWRPNGELLVSVSGEAPDPQVYRYDPAADSLTALPDLGEVIGVTTQAQVLAYAGKLTRFTDPSGGYTGVGLPVVWTAGAGVEPILPVYSYPDEQAAISADGNTVVMTARSGPSGPRGWQAFREKDGVWLPASRLWPYPQGVQPGVPQALSHDGSMAWATAMQGSYSYVVSLDIATGEWETWFTGADKLASIWDIVPALASKDQGSGGVDQGA
jgi:hypothetical protein